jgi:anti-anti-sigma factor
MDISIETVPGRALVHLAGRFDTQSSMALRNAARPLLDMPEVSTLAIDLAQVSFIDSSALGLLLLLREQAMELGKTVALANCSPDVMRVLSITHFHKLFPME